MVFDIMELQNGSDIRGVSSPGVANETVNLGEAESIAIGAAFTQFLSQKVGKNPFDINICIGHDPRISHEELEIGLMKGINYLGGHVSKAGLTSTPAMFMATVMPYYEFDGSIMITASHLPYNRNGFKFFTAEGGLNKEDIKEILAIAKKMHAAPEYYEFDDVNLTDMYAAHLRALITGELKGDLKGMKIAVDAGNGSGGFFVNKVLEPLGADISGSVYLEPDGMFPNHAPNPENPEALASIRKSVIDAAADLGIIFDTDVDRIAAVTADGKILARNEIVALAAALGANSHEGGTVVTDSITSSELHDFLENELKLKHCRYKRGYRNVINKAMELAAAGEDAFLAIETSGHAAYAENYYLDDGAYLAVRIIAAAAKLKAESQSLESLISGLRSPAESLEIRIPVMTDDFPAVGDKVISRLEEAAKKTEGLSRELPNYEGVRINFEFNNSGDSDYDKEADCKCNPNISRGWLLLRKSLHDPVLPVNIESSRAGGAHKAAMLLKDLLSDFNELDLSVFEQIS